jgi:hypothetical protein
MLSNPTARWYHSNQYIAQAENIVGASGAASGGVLPAIRSSSMPVELCLTLRN